MKKIICLIFQNNDSGYLGLRGNSETSIRPIQNSNSVVQSSPEDRQSQQQHQQQLQLEQQQQQHQQVN